MASKWLNTPCVDVLVFVAACPYCESVKAVRVRTEAAGDGTDFQRMVCDDCNRLYRIRRETRILPSVGNHVLWLDHNSD